MTDTSLPPNNPGTMLASSVDAEMAKFRDIQESIGQKRSDLQTLLGQSTENEMVLQELKLLSSSDNDNEKATTEDEGASSTTAGVVYKLIGPVLIRQNVADAIETVQKRIEFIVGEQKKLTTQMNDKEKNAQELAKKIQQMQSMLQQTTAQAVQAIAAQHQQGR